MGAAARLALSWAHKAHANIPVGCSPLCPSSELPDSDESGVNHLIHRLARKQICIFSKTPVFFSRYLQRKLIRCVKVSGNLLYVPYDDLTLIVLTCVKCFHMNLFKKKKKTNMFDLVFSFFHFSCRTNAIIPERQNWPVGHFSNS